MPLHRTIADAAAARALFAALAHAPDERCAVAYLDPKWRLLALRHIAGAACRVVPSIRTIVRDALTHDAAILLIAHNHPSGDATPSTEDIAFTTALARTLAAIDVTLADHLILAGTDWTSFRAAGLL